MAVLRLKDGEIFVDLTAISGTDGADAELPIHYTDKQVLTTDWVASTEYAGFGYQADISCPTTSAAMYADLALAHSEAITGNYSPVADTLDGYVRIFAKEVPAADITIPYIRVVNVSDGAPTGVFLSALANPASANSLLYGHEAYDENGTKLTGAGAYWQYAKNLRTLFLDSTTLTGEVELYLPLMQGSTALYQTFKGCTGITSLTLTWGNAGFLTTACYQSFYGMSNVKNITLNGSVIGSTQFTDTFRDCTSLVTIGGQPLDFTNRSPYYGNSFTNCPALVDVAFVAGSIQDNVLFSYSPLLSTTSLLSIANGLRITAATLTMHATSKTNMDAIMVDVTDGVATIGSTKTLTAFITSDKGWTIA